MNIDTKNKRKSRSLAKQLTPEYIADRAGGMRRDESMAQVFQNIVRNPHITIADPDKSGKSDLLYDGKNIGWIDMSRGVGWINDKQYDKYIGHGHAANYPVADDEEEYADDDLENDQPIEESTKITAADETDEWADNIEDALRSELSYGRLLSETLSAISSETGDFIDDVFMEADDFFDLNSKTDSKDFVKDFYNGEDLDSEEEHANPDRKYFRRDSANYIQSTDDPESIYEDDLLDDVIDYILDNLDATYYPDDILDIIAHYSEDIEE